MVRHVSGPPTSQGETPSCAQNSLRNLSPSLDYIAEKEKLTTIPLPLAGFKSGISHLQTTTVS